MLFRSAEKNKGRTVLGKSDSVAKRKEDEVDEACVTKPEAKDIAKGEVKKHEKKMHEDFKDRLLEREMTSAETKKKEKIVMSMKDNQASFKKKYGSRWKEVMYATATKKAMGEELNFEEEQLDEIATVSHNPSAEADLSTDTLSGRQQGVAKNNDFKSWKAKLEGDGINRPKDGQVAKDSTTARASVQAHGGPVAQPQIRVGEEVELDEMKDPARDPAVGSEPPFAPPYSTTKGTVTDKSGAKHTPMSRVKDLARKSMKKLKSEMLGKASGNN